MVYEMGPWYARKSKVQEMVLRAFDCRYGNNIDLWSHWCNDDVLQTWNKLC